MTVTEVSTSGGARGTRRSFDLTLVLAFAAIYILWGSSFLAIRVAVQLMPPWLAAGARFSTAGVVLYLFARLRGEGSPTARQWRSVAILAALMFVVTYGALFWAEQFVPSGITSVLEATIPLITMALEVFVLRKQAFRWPPLIAVLVGFGGVAFMLFRNNGQHFGLVPCFAVIGASTAWSLGSVLTRSLPLPSSRVLTAGAEMMVGGAGLLLVSFASGDLHAIHHIPAKAIWCVVYLIVAASLIAYTAFVWLLGRLPATVVASHAYVNPVVAIALGHFLGGEVVTARTLEGAALVILSVAITLRQPSRR